MFDVFTNRSSSGLSRCGALYDQSSVVAERYKRGIRLAHANPQIPLTVISKFARAISGCFV